MHTVSTPILPAAYGMAFAALQQTIPAQRLVTDPLRTLAYGTDGSCYRMIPKIVVIVENEQEVAATLAACAAHQVPVTFRAAGTSLSGQAVTDGVLMVLGDGWDRIRIENEGQMVALQPGVIGAQANQALASYGRKIGPDPASINAAKIGGIAANNASGMCCGTAQNSYQTLHSLKLILADGTTVDTADAQSVAAFQVEKAQMLADLGQLAADVQADAELAALIRKKYKIKNTTGYSLNALVDYTAPLDILSHLMIGSEGTLGFMAEVRYTTVVEHKYKAASMMYFNTIEDACKAVITLKNQPVAAVELLDRAALDSVRGKPGLPDDIFDLDTPQLTALLVETRSSCATHLQQHKTQILESLSSYAPAKPITFTEDATLIAQLWNIRKGTFPSVGAMRETGTTVIIEDVAVPITDLATATLKLQDLFAKHNVDARIFGHALEGNLHFVFPQSFDTPADVHAYEAFMDDVADLIVKDYSGSLKAEHGTGRNMAPYVELEWGEKAYAVMLKLKDIFDPTGLLNPGVILNPDPKAHVQNLKPMPAAHELVDKCIECGFCEPRCPSAGLTLSPRQRIVGWREIRRAERAGDDPAYIHQLKEIYNYVGLETCAACGLCATSCPVGIETGALMKVLRGQREKLDQTPIGRAWAAKRIANNYGAAMYATRVGLTASHTMHRILGKRAMLRVMGRLRTWFKAPLWTPAMPKAAWRPAAPALQPPQRGGRGTVVYFPSCASRVMAPPHGAPEPEALPHVMHRILQRAGYKVILPEDLENLCCGMPFESKGQFEAADKKRDQLCDALKAAKQHDPNFKVVFDTSPCAHRVQQVQERGLAIFDVVTFLRDHVAPHLDLRKQNSTVAVHATCSDRKMGTADALADLTAMCVAEVIRPAGVECCGFAGDKGFVTPELNAHATRKLARDLPDTCTDGYSSSRTCEIGLTFHSGRPYRSVAYLLDACSAHMDKDIRNKAESV